MEDQSPIPVSASRPFSSRTLWVLLLALSPLAYVGSFYVARKLPSRNTPISIDRESAIQTALRFAASRQVDARGWSITIGAKKNDDLSEVLARVRPPVLVQVAASSEVTVRFRSPTSEQWFRALMTPTGHVIGFSLNELGTPQVLTDAAAEQIASDFLREFLGPSAPFELGSPKMHFINREKQDRMFDWQSTVPGFPPAKAYFHVETAGSRVISETCEISVRGTYLSQLHPALPVYYCLLGLSGLYLVGLGVFALVRYIRRAHDQEVSHRRTILVAAVCLVMSAFIIYSTAEATFTFNGAPPNRAQKIVFYGIFVVIFSFVAAFFGLTYGAGEGDVRSFYPGKLTSLDALLSGRIFSFNVARSILAGGASAGAILLVETLALAAVGATRPLEDNDLVNSVIQVFPLGHAFSATAMHAIAVAAVGLLVPIALLRPRLHKNWLFYTLLPLCPMLSACMSQDSGSWRNLIIGVLASVAVTCVPFFFGDFLAAISGVIAFDLVGKLIFRSVTMQRWVDLSLPVVYVGIVFLLLEVWFAERGTRYQ